MGKCSYKIDYDREMLPEIRDEYGRDRSLLQEINVESGYYKFSWRNIGGFRYCCYDYPEYLYAAA